MDILILGNGFDLAHGLKTKYEDFLNYCYIQLNKIIAYKPTDVFFTNMWIRHFFNTPRITGENWIDFENEIYSVLNFLHESLSLNSTYWNKLFSIAFDDSNFNFYNVDKYLAKTMYSDNQILNNYIRVEPHNCIQYKIFFPTHKDFVNYLYDQLREFTKLFENYLMSEVLSSINGRSDFQLSLKAIGVKEGSKNVHVLSFNYTDTCERLYKHKFNTYCELNIKPVYVHGKALANDSCNLVLGTHTFEFNPSQIPFPTSFNIFQKHYQRHKYGTIEPYQDLLRQIEKSKTFPKFHIIGHSLDKTDHKILQHILRANKDCVINIYYHKEEAQELLMNKIDTIIGEEEVMSKVRFIHQHDEQRGILKLKEKSIVVANQT